MDNNLAILLIMAMSIIGAVTLIVMTGRNRARASAALGPASVGADAAAKVTQLTAENDRLNGEVGGMKERLAVLERIATDPAERTAREIEQLR